MVIKVVYGSLKGNEVLITDIIDLYVYYFDFPADGSRMSSCYKMSPTKGRVSRKGIFFQFPQTTLYEPAMALLLSPLPFCPHRSSGMGV